MFSFYSITDCPEDVFVVDMKSPDGGRVIRRQTISYLGRGLFLIQYRMYMDYQDVSLSVTHNGQHLSGSPYSLGAMFHEDCACPLKTVEDWFTHFKCPAVEAQINQDLEPFRAEGVNLTGLFERAGLAYSSKSFVHYSLVNGQVKISSVKPLYSNPSPSTPLHPPQKNNSIPTP